MLPKALFFACVMLLASTLAAKADGVITIDVSYKVVLNPKDGQWPDGVFDASMDTAVDSMNTLLSWTSRGYRVRRTGPAIEVGGQGDTTGPSQWFDADFWDETGGILEQMEAAALADPIAYAWDFSAINVYIVNGPEIIPCDRGICSLPGHEIVVIERCSASIGRVHLHEIGHYFDLCHTTGCLCGLCGAPRIARDCGGTPNVNGVCDSVPGDDEISDTLCDLACWGPDDRAIYNYGLPYDQLTVSQQMAVDLAGNNLMFPRARSELSEGQLDRWTDIANGVRFHVTDGGRTRFIDVEADTVVQDGSSTLPYENVSDGVFFANPGGGDILLLRPGVYTENLTITKALTLRATRAGPATIGD